LEQQVQSSVPSRAVKSRLGGWCKMAASLAVRELQFSHCEPLLSEACSRGTGIICEARVRGTLAPGNLYQATASGYCNRLSRLILSVTVICEV
jgi:hypothetical protein